MKKRFKPAADGISTENLDGATAALASLLTATKPDPKVAKLAIKNIELFEPNPDDSEDDEDEDDIKFVASSAKDDGTIDCVWYGGASVPRVDRNTGDPYMLTLSMEGCRMERLNAGAPVFDSHMDGNGLSSWAAGTMGSRAQMGVVKKAWADGNKGLATLQFDMGNPMAADLHRKAATGIINNLSFGTWIYKREKMSVDSPDGSGDDTQKMENYTATDWEPFEISPVPVPADFGTQFLAAQSGETIMATGSTDLPRTETIHLSFDGINKDRLADAIEHFGPCIKEFLSAQGGTSAERAISPKGAIPVEPTTTQDAGSARNEQATLDAVRAETIALERQRVTEIRSMGVTHKQEPLAGVLIENGTSVADARTRFTAASEIMTRSKAFPQLESFTSKFISRGGTLDQYGDAALEQLAVLGQAGTDGKPYPIRSEVTVTRDRRDSIREQLESALLMRHDPSFFSNWANQCDPGNGQNIALKRADKNKYDQLILAQRDLPTKGRECIGMSLLDMARMCLQASGVNVNSLRKDEVAERALRGQISRYTDYSGYVTDVFAGGDGAQSSSDFPAILANVANKTLRQGYEAAARTFQVFCKQVTAQDFKPVNRVQLSDSPVLAPLNESGEYTRAAMKDSNQNYSLVTFGKIVALTRKVIINDDLQAFTRVPAALGVAAARLESDKVWAVLTGNQVMAEDSVALFHANHSNYNTGSTSALTLGAATPPVGMTAARSQMRKQAGPQGTYLNLIPRFCAVPTSLETPLLQMIAPLNIASTDATKVVPEWVRSIVPIVEPRLDAASSTGWYIIADPADIDTVEYCYLEGQQGVYLETRQPWESDGIEIKARLDFASAAVDFRGLQFNAGV